MCSIRKPGRGVHVCGGFVIDKNWIMTAAHCLDPDVPNSAGMSPLVYCNIYRRQERDESKRFCPSRCYLHHLWDSQTSHENDIALCRSDSSVRTDVDIPTLVNFGHQSTPYDKFVVLGWGETARNSGPANVLQIGSSLDFVPRSTCNKIVNFRGIIKDSMICAGGQSGDTCRGDSGGPLLIRDDPGSTEYPEDPQLDFIVGITSFGVEGCIAESPGIYTRISCYRPWIDCIMKGTEQDCSVHNPCGEDSSSPSGEDSALCSGVQKSATFDEADALERILIAISSDESETVKKILCDGLSPNAVYDNHNNSLLGQAADYDAIESAKVLLEYGSEIEQKNIDGQTALSIAAGSESIAVLKFLIESGADIDTEAQGGLTPLLLVAGANQPEIAQILIDNGANIESIEERRSRTPLHLAVLYNSTEDAKVLIDNGAIIDRGDRYGLTALHIAAQRNHIAVAKILIANGANVNSRERYEWTSLHTAAAYNSIEIAKELIANGAKVDATERWEWTPLHITSQNNTNFVSEVLIANGANLENRDRYEWTPLHFAARYNSLEVVEWIIESGAAIKAKTNTGSSPLVIAAYHGHLYLVSHLLNENAKVNSVDDNGRSALFWAAVYGHISVVRELLDNGASKRLTDNTGNTPFDVVCNEYLNGESCSSNVFTTLKQLLEP